VTWVWIYLDMNLYSRPFDDQSQERVRLEAYAFLEIFAEVLARRPICLNADILRLELRRNPAPAELERSRRYWEGVAFP
jgi:hypothetical protein